MQGLRKVKLKDNLMIKISFLFRVIIFFFILQNHVVSKGLPPGTGSNDIPANVLILLDKSGSMSTSISTGGIRLPQAIAVDSSDSASYVGMSSSIKKLNYTNSAGNMEVDDNWSFAGTGGCTMGDIRELRLHNNKLYVIDLNKDKLFRIDINTTNCDWSVPISNPDSMDIKNNILYALGDEMLVYDLSSATPSKITCGYSGNLKDDGKNAQSLAIDSSGSNLYLHRNSNLKRYEIDGSSCPSTSRTSDISTSINTVHSLIFEPGSDTILYVPKYMDKFYKVTLNANKNSMTKIQANASYIGSGVSTVSPNKINVDYPYAIDIDSTNNRIHFVSRGNAKSTVHVIDFDLQFIKESGAGVNKTRMTGAVEAIQSIMQDSSLTSHVDFGLGVWSESGASFTGWSGDITNGTAIPCHSKNCLKVRVHRQGAAKINTVAPTIAADGWATYSKSFADLADKYYLHSTLSPIDDNLDCQNSHVIVIGDGAFTDNINAAKSIISNLNLVHEIKTHVVAYGGGIGSSALLKFDEFADAGGTDDVIIADTPNSLKTQLRAKISQIIVNNFAFTAPSIPPSKNETTSAVYQSSFKHSSNQAWRGQLIRTTIDANGNLDLSHPDNWDAQEELPDPDDRKIWSVIPGTDYRIDHNNFVEANASEIADSLRSFNYEVQDFHSVSGTPISTRRCAGTAPGVADGNDDDVIGLINFLRGEDYFDYDNDCNLIEARKDGQGNKIYLGDFYHSELLVVGAPDANTAYTNKSQEAYWRSIKGYGAWAKSSNLANRKEMIYVGGNDGMLHAFNSENGKEEWAFIPPLLMGNLPTMVDKALNKSTGGGSNAIYGVDGSPVVHDMYFDGPNDSGPVWHTILMVPYGRGGKGFSILDVTNPDDPIHLQSVFNDSVTKNVYIIDSSGVRPPLPYVGHDYAINQLKESIQVTQNYSADPQVGSEVCNSTGNDQCYESNVWTLETNPKIPGLTKSDFEVFKDGNIYDNFNINYDGSGDVVFTFSDNMRYVAYGDPSLSSSDLLIKIKAGSTALGVTSEPRFDYSRLGETWSQPRIIRMPNQGAGDTNIEDDIYVAILGGGYGAQNPEIGSGLFVINLEVEPTTGLYGTVEKYIDIEDIDGNGITNSTPALPTVITSDEISANFTGALVYLNDFEGKVTKFNLTNMSTDQDGNSIALYDNTTLFSAESTNINGRYMYHSMDAGRLKGSNNFWMYMGTGDYERLTAKEASPTDPEFDNLLIGIRDKDFPYYKNVATVQLADNLDDCSDTTTDDTGILCPSSSQRGWVIHLSNAEKVTAEPTLNKGRVLFPIFQPTQSVNTCTTGKALICNVDAKCGTPKNTEIGSANDLDCLEVGTGVLSKIVVFGNKLFANIAGEANVGSSQPGKTDLVSINAASTIIESFRNSWRENF
jgi:type IV pilus assembly protein PilY1